MFIANNVLSKLYFSILGFCLAKTAFRKVENGEDR